MKYLVSILKEMNLAATGHDERRSEMHRHNRPQEDLGPASKQDEGRLKENGDAARHAAPEEAISEDAGAAPSGEQLSEKTQAVDAGSGLAISIGRNLQTGKTVELPLSQPQRPCHIRAGKGDEKTLFLACLMTALRR